MCYYYILKNYFRLHQKELDAYARSLIYTYISPTQIYSMHKNWCTCIHLRVFNYTDIHRSTSTNIFRQIYTCIIFGTHIYLYVYIYIYYKQTVEKWVFKNISIQIVYEFCSSKTIIKRFGLMRIIENLFIIICKSIVLSWGIGYYLRS